MVCDVLEDRLSYCCATVCFIFLVQTHYSRVITAKMIKSPLLEDDHLNVAHHVFNKCPRDFLHLIPAIERMFSDNILLQGWERILPQSKNRKNEGWHHVNVSACKWFKAQSNQKYAVQWKGDWADNSNRRKLGDRLMKGTLKYFWNTFATGEVQSNPNF